MFSGWVLQLILFLSVLTICSVFLGRYMANVFSGNKTFLMPLLMPIEKTLYKLFGVNTAEEMNWKTYALNLIIFNAIGIVALFLILEFQHLLPFNPNGSGPLKWDLALNTAISFVTNTNWQNYGGESTMSYLTQMLGMTVQNFLSAATGIAAMVAFIRAFVHQSVSEIGNFWVDLTRSIIHILL
ncbi:MAG: potassium-transporting ATPase subunit KdpA, partial [Endomicrobiales bacterium]|nr:potassium-transporting ATPase subunit KdpA [Endomicrobiales bacterium]